MEFYYYSPSETFVVLTADQFALNFGHCESKVCCPRIQHNVRRQDSHLGRSIQQPWQARKLAKRVFKRKIHKLLLTVLEIEDYYVDAHSVILNLNTSNNYTL